MVNTSNKKNTSNRTKTNNRKTTTNNRKPAPAPSKPGFADYYHAFTKTRVFRPIATIVIIILAVLINMLIAWNNYDRFFLFLGIELFIVAAIWLFGLLFSMSTDTAKKEG